MPQLQQFYSQPPMTINECSPSPSPTKRSAPVYKKDKQVIKLNFYNKKKTKDASPDLLSQKSRKSSKSMVTKKKQGLVKPKIKKVKSSKSLRKRSVSSNMQPVYSGPLTINDGQYQVVVLENLNHQGPPAGEELTQILNNQSTTQDQSALEAFEFNNQEINPAFARTQEQFQA